MGIDSQHGTCPPDRSLKHNSKAGRIRRPLLACCGTRGSTALLVADAHFLYQPCILGELVARHAAEFFRRTAAHGKAQFFELAANIRITERLHHFGMETGYDLLGRTRGSENGKPGIEEEARESRFVDGRDIGELRQPLLCADTDQPKLTAAHQGRDRAQSLKADRNLAGGNIGRRLRCSLVGHMASAAF